MLGRSPVFSVVNSARTEFGPFRCFAKRWQARRDLNPRHPVLETGALAGLSYWPTSGLGLGLPGFLVNRVLPATGAEFLPLHAVGMLAFVLGIRVVPLLAFAASERDQIAHGSPPFTRESP